MENLRKKIYDCLEKEGLRTDYEHFHGEDSVIAIDDMMHDALAVYFIKIHHKCYYVGNDFIIPKKFSNSEDAIKEFINLFREE
jgi:hypothetical protein